MAYAEALAGFVQAQVKLPVMARPRQSEQHTVMQWLRAVMAVLGGVFIAQGAFYFLRPGLVWGLPAAAAAGSTGAVELALGEAQLQESVL